MIGLLPAAGNAARLYGLPKFLLPIGGDYLLRWHIQRMREAGCTQIFLGGSRRSVRWLDEYADGARVYLANECETMNQTLLSGYQTTGFETYKTHDCLFGMPDSYWDREQVYQTLAARIEAKGDVWAAVFRIRPEQRGKLGVCDIQDERIVDILDKDEQAQGEWAWGALAWKPEFWKYIVPGDPHVGYALVRAIDDGINVEACFTDSSYWDCGTEQEYFECIRYFPL